MSTDATPLSRPFATPEELAGHVADWLVERAGASGQQHFAVCLSGGSTPKRLYELLAAPPRRAWFPWPRAHWFWGDERAVPPDDPESNFGMVREAMLRQAPVPAANIHAIPTQGMSPLESAVQYEAMLKDFYGADVFDPARPLFDLTLLGLGEDGHVASLFPGSFALVETKRWVLPVVGERQLDRITLTYPALESSRAIAFLVAGERKREILARVRKRDPALPATRLCSAGTVYWFTDRAAAATSMLAGE